MTCFYPVKAFRSRERSETGGFTVTFNATKALIEGSSFAVPCGRCIGCRLDRAQDWAVRCMHEAQMHPENCFLTLTYDNKNLPDDYSIDVRTHQLFLKRLRESVPNKIRFFACGEYGSDDLSLSETPQRPHYHYLIFNYRPYDLKLYSKKNNNPLYTSEKIQSLWSFGFSTVGNVTYESAAYCARYTLKKIGGDMADDYYTRVHPLTGKIVRVAPESMWSSRRPGIGDAWYEKFKSDVYPSDFVVVEGRKHAVPKYYTKKLAEEERNKIKRRRKLLSNKRRADNTPARLKVREKVLLAKTSVLKREV